MMLFSTIRRLKRDNKGVAAAEFALIGTFIVVMLIASVDAVFALTAKRKVALATHSMADLAAREEVVGPDSTEVISEIGRLIMTPFDEDNSALLVVSGITVLPGGRQGVVEWSDAYGTDAGGAEHADGSTFNFDSELTPDQFVIVAETTMEYNTVVGYLETLLGDDFAFFTLSDQAIFHSRSGTSVGYDPAL